MPRDDLHPKSQCYKCKGCQLLRDPSFKGLIQCIHFEKKDKGVWCADETIDNYIKTGKIK